MNLKSKCYEQEKQIIEMKIDLFRKNLEISDFKIEIVILKKQIEILDEKSIKTKQAYNFPPLISNLYKFPENCNTQTFHNMKRTIILQKQNKLDKISFSKTIVQLFIECGIPLNVLKDQKHDSFINNDNDGKTLDEIINTINTNDYSITTKQRTNVSQKNNHYPSPLRILLEHFAQCSLYKITRLRELVDDISYEVICNIRKIIGSNDIFVMTDSTPVKGYNIENVIIGVLTTSSIRPMLIQCNFTNESMTGEHISDIIKNTLDDFFNHDCSYHQKIKFFISDQAKNMIKCGKILKNKYESMMHFSCIVHCLHNICVTIINNTMHVKSFIQMMTAILPNNIKHFSYFKQYFKKNAPTPVITRFGSFLNASFFYYENFHCIVKFLEKVLENKASGSKVMYYSNIKKLLENNIYNLYLELQEIYKFQFIANYINDLESNNMQL